jgi:lycopene beta-cyclase
VTEPFDVAIVGAGVAGLCLAQALLDRGDGRSILLVDGARDDDELRTLSFWTSGPTALDALVRHRWKTLRVVDHRGGARLVELAEHTYQTLFFADLQRAVKERLARDARHRVVEGKATAVSSDAEGVRIEVGDLALTARWAFDSRFRRASLEVDLRRYHLAWQRFHGLIVRVPRDAFDPSAAVFLDFRAGAADASAAPGTVFAYLLPFSSREALVELVSLEPVDAEHVLREYLSRCHAVEDFEILDHEAGSSPMTEQPFEALGAPSVRRIGIPAGMLKASTGYAVTRILEDTALVVRSLEAQGHPLVRPPASALYRFLDGVFLELWTRFPAHMPAVFAALFARVPADRVLRFLDERTSWLEIVALVARLPVQPFARAFVSWLARRWRREGGS